MLDVGDRVPDFSLPDHRGGTFELAAQLGRGPLVLFFYPKDDTTGCTAEVCGFRDATPELAAAGAKVWGISSDSVASHQRFAGKHAVPYDLLADEGGEVRKLFGVGKALFGLSDGRVTFVLDSSGVVRHRFDSLIRATKHVDEAVATVRRLAAR
jgi:thioredoxin-dependent peroxiredoxin